MADGRLNRRRFLGTTLAGVGAGGVGRESREYGKGTGRGGWSQREGGDGASSAPAAWAATT